MTAIDPYKGTTVSLPANDLRASYQVSTHRFQTLTAIGRALCGPSLAVLLAVGVGAFFVQDASGQGGDVQSGVPYSTSRAGRINLGTTPLRIWHSTRAYGQEDGETAIGGRYAVPNELGVYFFDGQFRESNGGEFSLNLGGGYRWRYADPFSNATRIFGVSGWYDGQQTVLDNFFNQGGVSLESLGDLVDLRFNANLPGESMKVSGPADVGEFFYTGNNIQRLERTRGDVSLSNVTGEIALRVPDMNLWGYGGGYALDGNNVSTGGYKLGARGYAYDDLLLDFGVSDDDEFGTLATFQVVWTPGRVSSRPTQCVHNINDRMREPVYRPMYVATQQRTFLTNTSTLTDEDGDIARVVHVDSTATAPGDGTFENPLTSLDDVFANSNENDIVLVHSGSTFNGESAVLQTEQRFLGEGGDVVHTIQSLDFDTVELPETAVGARSGSVPVIDGATIAGVQIGTAALADATSIEVNNFDITGGDVGIRSTATGTGTLNVGNVAISDTGSHGVEVVGSNATHTLIDVTITDAGDAAGEAGLKVSGGDSTVNIAGQIVQGAAATDTAAIFVDGEHTGTVNMQLPFDAAAGDLIVDAQNGTGLQFDNADGIYNLSGAVELTGGDAGIDFLNGTDGTLTVSNATITDPTGTAINIDGGEGSLSYTGIVNQSNAATALAVSGNHTGTLNFNEATTDAGVFDVTNGDGLQFNDANGAYVFNDTGTLNGGDAGIDIVNVSSGTFVFTDATITNPTGDAVVISGNTAVDPARSAVVTFNNAAITNNAGRAVVVESNTNADVVIDGTITTTDGATGVLVQNNTNTNVSLPATLSLETGANDAFTVQNNTSGSVSATGIGNTITTTTGTAVRITDSVVAATGINLGTINADGAAQAVVLTNVTGGVVNLGAGGTTAGDGGLIQNITGTAFTITDVENVVINAVRIENGVGDGIDLNHTGGISPADFTAAVSNNRITGITGSGIDFNTTAGDQVTLILDGNNIDDTAQAAMALNFNGDGTSAVTVTDNIAANSNGQEAFLLTTTGASPQTLTTLIEGNTFNNDDPTAFAADIRAEGQGVVNVTIRNNNFANADLATGVPVRVQVDNAGANLHLDLDANTSTPANAGNDGYELNQVNGSFEVESLADVTTRNTGTVSTSGTVVNDPVDVPEP
ncbi:beta strand repeat-containing protein [Adhaeretor mobilis]|uniref:Inverse autotransporter beta-domain domain-containing protein n=1 Tax=Adhaeretor mobilis TaxID=1930276 RepID=A0A517MVQ0_9BACT|nr:hypothetical protein [Adhaeretor mobilis]QDS98877.1 hypothetical protein HG15A2_21640 [Adhaeretor mobilis]